MRLKKLQLQGFKTFAERTEIAFSEGVTAVVGPNGSGKSNLGDAVLWVLGEQKASAMRGTKAQDVIFAGSDRRKPMGMAEVSLTVDNADGTLPVEFAEVTVTRRAYRTGEGEYFINKVPCRLKDIYELFLDTGVGRESYALVNQSEIDAVLSVNPEDRRGLFEEAAGIKKYRVKKREALRKLEATETNLQRVRDILAELAGRLEPLRAQAERARRFIEIRDRLRAIESDLLIVDLRFADYELTAARQAREEEEAAVAKHAARIAAAEARAQGIATSLGDAEMKLETCRLQHGAAMTQAERAESERALAAQRVESLASSQRLLAQELEELAERRQRLAAQVTEAEAERRAAQDQEIVLARQVTERQAQVQQVGEEIASLNRRGERRRAEALELARRQAARQAEAARAEARVAELEAGLPAVREEITRGEVMAHSQAAVLEAAKEATEAARQELARVEKTVAEAQAARDAARQAAQAAQARVSAAQSEAVALSTRLRTLQELEAAQEGYFAGVKAVFEAVRHGALTGEFTVVADSFQTPPGYETALEVALAASLQDIITATEEEAKAAIAYLHSNRAGRATFLPLDRMRPSRDTLDLGPAAHLTGVRGAVLDIITFEPKFRPALDVLLGRVFVCETLDDALRSSNVTRGWNRVVTLSGEIVLPTGALTGGRQAERGRANLLGRKTEIASLQGQLQEKRRAQEQATRALAEAERERERSERALAEAQAARQEAQGAVSEAGRRAAFAESEVRRAEEGRAQAARRLEAAQASLAQAREQAAAAGDALASGGALTAGADEALAGEAARLRELTQAREAVQGELTTARVALATVSEKAASLERSLRSARADAEQVMQAEERKARQAREAQAEHQALADSMASREAESRRAAAQRDTAMSALEARGAARQALLQESYQANAQMRALTEERAKALEAIHKHELREARLGAQRDQLAARLWDEYEIRAEEALALRDDPEIVAGAPQEVARLRRELRGLGEVNTGALQDYEETRSRHEFLTTQRADLDESRAKLLEAIRDIDASTRGVFMETFRAVAHAFQDIFARLFGGGQTQLTLTDPDDLLETGVDIHVQPPGKKRQPLALLSGGERALTAAALLFAFLKVKPSPFVVLDEVDAPLDGANVERFADLLREFGGRSQFIVITHNPVTMEAAPLWYGVTMQEAGISRVLSMQVPAVPQQE
ncbi:MAG: chromosome segregation protein SMC [Armatimonadetes bacterium]|nr:chromosome segregation protein SMC [Armatimonadota bacterium]